MKIVIKNSLVDFLNFGRHLKVREGVFNSASSKPKKEGAVNKLSEFIHPDSQELVIDEVIDECPDIKSFILRPAGEGQKIAPFRAGQYLVLSSRDEGLILKRPLSISSTPTQSIKGNYYRVTLKRKSADQGGFFSEKNFRLWQKGFVLNGSEPQGTFYYDSIRDGASLVCIAGGSGITPFCSLIPELLEKGIHIKLFYGFNAVGDDVFSADFRFLAEKYSGSFSFYPLAMESQGVIRASMIKKELEQDSVADERMNENYSFFICGPPALHSHMDKELALLSLRPKFVRRENYGRGTVYSDKDVREYKLTLQNRDISLVLKALSNETLLTALERGGVDAPSACRAGECGWCRSQLLSGEVSTDKGLTGLRKADKKFGWIHPCVCYPEGDINLKVPENRKK